MNKILFIITGSIACYKAVEAIRLLKKQNYHITPILTKGGAEFITPLLLTAISGNETLSDLFCASQEAKIKRPNSAATKSRLPQYLKKSICQRGIGRTSRSSSVPLRTMLGTKAAVTATLIKSKILPPNPVVRSFCKINTSRPSGAPFEEVSSRLS